MRLTQDNKREITERIRHGAAIAFRELGYEGVSLDELMKRSGLTRGTFYAHYKSKRALFEDVARHEHPLLAMLIRRPGKTAHQLKIQLLEIFEGYLNPDNLEKVFVGCSLAALTGDVTRAPEAVKIAHGAAFDDILEEMARGQSCTTAELVPALILASGAIWSAQAVSDKQQKATILKTSWASFRKQIKSILA